MNTPGDEPGDELTRAYRNTSDAQAGRPATATRAAILAEARAATLRRTPAANDSRYVWRAAAGIAVLGVAVLLWRQADRSVSPDLAVVTAERTTADPVAESKVAAPPARADLASGAEVTASAGTAAEADVAAAAPQASADKATEPAARMEQEIARAAAPPVRERADASINAAGALARAAPDFRLLLQREFPDVWNDVVAPRTVWLVTDAEGNAVRKGTDTPSPGNWNYVEVKTASGRSLQLAVMQTD